MSEPDANPQFGQAALSMLADLSQAFAESIDLEQTLIEAVSRIATHMRAQAASLFLTDERDGGYVCRASFGPVDVVGLKIAHGHGIVGRAMVEVRTQLVRDVQHDPDFISAGVRVKGFMPRTMVCAPLVGKQGALGALQVINKENNELFNQNDADVLRILAVPTTMALANARLVAEVVAQNRIRREFELAREMQKTLLPKRRQGYPISAVNRPAREISGDFYDFFDLPDGRIAFAIGDVSGKGMDAALLMVRASALLRFYGKAGTAPALWLAKANDELCETVRFGMFVCALIGVYDPALGIAEIASAGFPPALLRDQAGQVREIPAHGPPLGILSGIEYESTTLCMAERSLYCYSDGLTDVRGADGATIGVEGVKALIDSVDRISHQAKLRGMLMQLRHQRLPDDTTILLLADQNLPARLLAESGCLSDAENLRPLRQMMRRVLDTLGFESELRNQLVLAVDEAAANVIRHGYKGATDGKLELSAWLVADRLEIRLRDFAPRIDQSCVKPRDLAECKPGGLGVNLIDMSFDRWWFDAPENAEGNVLVMTRRLPF